MSDKTALCSVLAASASHARLSMATLHLSVAYPLKYRSMALRGLQERAAHANSKADPDNPVCLVALTTILGLLIDDLITYRGEFPALTQLADFWTRKYVSPDQDCYDSTVFHFLAEQITM